MLFSNVTTKIKKITIPLYGNGIRKLSCRKELVFSILKDRSWIDYLARYIVWIYRTYRYRRCNRKLPKSNLDISDCPKHTLNLYKVIQVYKVT